MNTKEKAILDQEIMNIEKGLERLKKRLLTD